MILDIEGKEINVGDEVIGSPTGWYGVIKMLITKETNKRIKYKKYDYVGKVFGHAEYYTNKSALHSTFYKP